MYLFWIRSRKFCSDNWDNSAVAMCQSLRSKRANLSTVSIINCLQSNAPTVTKRAIAHCVLLTLDLSFIRYNNHCSHQHTIQLLFNTCIPQDSSWQMGVLWISVDLLAQHKLVPKVYIGLCLPDIQQGNILDSLSSQSNAPTVTKWALVCCILLTLDLSFITCMDIMIIVNMNTVFN